MLYWQRWVHSWFDIFVNLSKIHKYRMRGWSWKAIGKVLNAQ